MDASFYILDEELFHPTPLTRGPWDPMAQHGGPPSALLGGAIAAWGADASRFFLARLTVTLLRPAPLAPLALSVTPTRLGRSVQRLQATLSHDGRPVLSAEGLRIRRKPLTVPAPDPGPPWPAPDTLPRFTFPFFQDPVGYHTAVELAVASGAWGRTPVGFWARPRAALVAGRATTPVERVLILADAQSGMGVPLPPAQFTFINPDLTVYFEREPVGDWVGFDIRSTASAEGVGLSQSAIRDAAGLLGRSAQSLLVDARP